jgi:NADP-dependent 3-hydroxy acid dehydrogenase YdfG
MTRPNDRIAIVTGASSGIGEATAIALAAQGASVVIAARRADRLTALRQRIESAGGTALDIPCDVTDRQSVKNLIDETVKQFGRIDILINNAGIMANAPMTKCRIDDWDDMIDVNIKGLLYGVGYVMPIMLQQKSGHIINVSSVAGRKVMNGGTVYCATKHAVHVISEGLRSELAESAPHDGNKIRVTVIAPGVVMTELPESIRDADHRELSRKYYNSVPGPLTSEDIAQAILYAVSTPAHVNVNEILIRPVSQKS